MAADRLPPPRKPDDLTAQHPTRRPPHQAPVWFLRDGQCATFTTGRCLGWPVVSTGHHGDAVGVAPPGPGSPPSEYDELVAGALAAPVYGWDFGWLAGRALGSDPTWSPGTPRSAGTPRNAGTPSPPRSAPIPTLRPWRPASGWTGPVAQPATFSAGRRRSDPSRRLHRPREPSRPGGTAERTHRPLPQWTTNAYDQTTGFTPAAGHLCTDPHRRRPNERATNTDALGTTTREVTLTRTVPAVTARLSTNPAATEAYEPAPPVS